MMHTEDSCVGSHGNLFPPHLQTDLPVHKVGYLTKEGGRVKSWKKRLFVLNSLGLYYYKADDVRVGG